MSVYVGKRNFGCLPAANRVANFRPTIARRPLKASTPRSISTFRASKTPKSTQPVATPKVQQEKTSWIRRFLAPFSGAYGKSSLIITGVLLPVTLMPFSFATTILTLGLTGLDLKEYSQVFLKDALPSSKKFFIGGGLALGGCLAISPQTVAPLAFLSLSISWIYTLFRQQDTVKGQVNMANGILGINWISFGLAHTGYLHSVPENHLWLLGTIMVSGLSDVFGMAVGKAIGRKKMIPHISPGKTVGGYMGQIAGAFVGAGAATYMISHFQPTSIQDVLVLGTLGAVFAPMGDLAASMLKRSKDTKDFGSLIPGHGGILDRVDSLLFLAPAVYYWLTLLR